MTDTEDLWVIERLRDRVNAAGKLPFLTVDTHHLRALYARLDELDPNPPQSQADGIVAAINLQAHQSAAPGDFA